MYKIRGKNDLNWQKWSLQSIINKKKDGVLSEILSAT